DERFARALARAKAQVRQGEVARLGRRLAALLGAAGGGAAGADGGTAAGTAPMSGASTRPEPGAPPLASTPEPLTRLLVRVGDRTVPVRLDEVDWIEAADYYVRLHAQGRALLHRETMGRLEARLDPMRWVRVHRSAIVNVERVRELQPYVRGDQVVILRDGTRLRLSRSRRDALVRALDR
ncbi:MAG TPA: LytTR family DNA-binding domain-containing protein, partial [Gemmatimonadaceae bacterium]|nr:LytTR family DNA-binding domain-containing protein [Gemmatimonadaceae bacterium]